MRQAGAGKERRAGIRRILAGWMAGVCLLTAGAFPGLPDKARAEAEDTAETEAAAIPETVAAAENGTEAEAVPETKTASETKKAKDITRKCKITPASKKKEFKKAMDSDYKTYWNSAGGNMAAFEIQAPAGESIGAVWFQWYEHEHAIAIQIRDAEGNWQEIAQTGGIYLSECLELPESLTENQENREIRVTNPRSAKKSTPIPLAEIHIYTPGELPENVQRWKAPCEKADLMLLAGHPDDELLWFGGVLPVYAGVQKKNVQVCILVPTLPRRRLEELDGLWTCGVRNYPAFGYLRDTYSLSVKDQYSKWGEEGVQKLVTGWVRRFRPEVLITHDFNGEYGHGAHRVCADAAVKALSYAVNPKKFRESYDQYGGWDVPKLYIHLYPENVIDFDWRIPLEEFGGKTAFDVATEAFRCHVSQWDTDYRVEDSGKCDCSLFGLYRSLVGPDEEKNDLFEHITGYLVEDEV